MDSDSTACTPSPSSCAVHGHDGRLTNAGSAQACAIPLEPPSTVRAIVAPGPGDDRPKRLVSSYPRPERFADVARPLAPKRLRRASRRSRVLVVDDEPMMCELVGYMLQPEFEVVTLSSGRAALDQLRSGERFDVLLSDLMMPELSGIDLFRALCLEQPFLAKRMIFMTGGTFTDVMDAFLVELGVDPLLKPFGRDVVYERVTAQLAQLI